MHDSSSENRAPLLSPSLRVPSYFRVTLLRYRAKGREKYGGRGGEREKSWQKNRNTFSSLPFQIAQSNFWHPRACWVQRDPRRKSSWFGSPSERKEERKLVFEETNFFPSTSPKLEPRRFPGRNKQQLSVFCQSIEFLIYFLRPPILNLQNSILASTCQSKLLSSQARNREGKLRTIASIENFWKSRPRGRTPPISNVYMLYLARSNGKPRK